MSAASDYLEGAALDHFLGITSITAPANVYLALFTAAPNDAGGGTEVSGGSYARQAVTFDRSGDTATNNGDVTFATATASWGTVTHWGLFDAATSGNLLFHGAFDASRTIGSGDTFEVANDGLDITAA